MPGFSFRLVIAMAVISAGIESCSKTNANTNDNGNHGKDTTITAISYYIDFTADGNRIFKIQGVDSLWGNLFTYSATPEDTAIYPYNRINAVFAFQNSSNYPAFTIGKGNINLAYYWISPSSKPLPVNIADTFFKAGAYPYAQPGNDTTVSMLQNSLGNTVMQFNPPLTKELLTDGVNITWVDSTGKMWASYFAPGDQTGSHFNITDNEADPAGSSGATSFTSISATFDCRLYDGNGNVLNITSGRCRIKSNF